MDKMGVKPEDILSEGESFADLNGVRVRKGSIAAFLQNIDLLGNPQALEQQKIDALNMIKQLAPAVVAAGLHKHAIFKNQVVQALLEKEAAHSSQ